MSVLGLGAVAGHFGRDVEANLIDIEHGIAAARRHGIAVLAFPEACLGGYLSVLGAGRDGSHDEQPDSLPPVMDVDGPEIARVAAAAREMVVVVGLCESDGADRYNSAAIVTGDGVLGVHRKVHQPLGERLHYAAGSTYRAVDTPAGRIGALICYDKAFPEAARGLALDGAEIVACISAWPASRTATAHDVADDRWTHRFRLFDQARALENQLIWLASNQTGTFGRLRFVGHAEVVGPGGNVLATTAAHPGLASVRLDPHETLRSARRAMFHLGDRRPDTYGAIAAPEPARGATCLR